MSFLNVHTPDWCCCVLPFLQIAKFTKVTKRLLIQLYTAMVQPEFKLYWLHHCPNYLTAQLSTTYWHTMVIIKIAFFLWICLCWVINCRSIKRAKQLNHNCYPCTKAKDREYERTRAWSSVILNLHELWHLPVQKSLWFKNYKTNIWVWWHKYDPSH